MDNSNLIAGLESFYENGQYMELLSLANEGVDKGIFSEEMYTYVFKALEKLKMNKPIIAMYKNAEYVFESNDVPFFPTPQIERVFNAAVDILGDEEASMIMIKEDLRHAAQKQKNMTGEPLYCNYEVFKHVYSIMARNAERTGQVISILLVNLIVKEENGQKEKLNLLKGRVRKILSSGALRKSDVFTEYSNNKYIIALSTDRAIGASYAAKRLELRFSEELSEENVDGRVTVSMTEID